MHGNMGGGAGGGQGLRARADDRVPQLFRVGLHAVAVDRGGGHRDFRPAEYLVAGANKQGLCRRRALVDGEDVHSAGASDAAPGSTRIASGSVTSAAM